MTNAIERPTTTTTLPSGPIEYRHERHGPRTVLLLHGGHMRASIALGERELVEAGYSLLVPSRPGYGRTPVAAGSTPAELADSVALLCRKLGLTSLAAVIGIPARGRPAAALATRHRGLVDKVVMLSAVSTRPWPDDRRTRQAARIAFAPIVEPLMWYSIRTLIRIAPTAGLRMMFGDLSTLPAADVVAALSPADRATATALFTTMRSATGFRCDLQAPPGDQPVEQPMHVVATRKDGTVAFDQAQALAAQQNARLVESTADSHLLWFSSDRPRIAEHINKFLAADRGRQSSTP